MVAHLLAEDNEGYSKRTRPAVPGPSSLALSGPSAAAVVPFCRARDRLSRFALASGPTALTMAYAVGHITGGHFNRSVGAQALRRSRTSRTGDRRHREYVSQHRLFWIAPIVGAAIAGFVTRLLHEVADTV
jgi:glycerol uptake facilitator-like aquaporin